MINLTKIQWLTYGLPLLVILSSIAIAMSPLLRQYPELATAITYDLTFTAPLLFLLLRGRSKISKLRAIPFFIGGILIASYLLPETAQVHLDYIKSYVLPLVELIALTFFIFNIHKAIRIFKSNSDKTTDFYRLSKLSAKELFGKSKFGTFFTTEIIVMYYALFSWRIRKRSPNEFTNYRNNASIALAGALLMVVFIETYAFHILLVKWSELAAWIFSAASLYTALFIVAHCKALMQRPSIINNAELILKNGLIADIYIPLDKIDEAILCNQEIYSKEIKIGNLGISKESTNHNVALYFKAPQTIEKIYGFTEQCDVLLVYMDNKKEFVEKLTKAIQMD